ncbi:uncharacterized protein EMPS_09772 [Entomortierella parvispora]|uniref:Ankyrin repeat protein n=1 Tax=Entomortierella parvispora TaxID=205924 RepID=A0A9P3HJ02_9FUNG|nr:uncharacterized protein EMPS_09772 [Entomortierella parvispora]
MNLAQAVASNDLAVVRELCQNGQDPNQTFACSPRQSAYAVQPIMGHAQNFEPDDVLYGATPLNLAVLNGNEEIVRVLIDAGADLNKKDGRGRTALLCALYGLDTLTITPANLALISQTSPAHLSILRHCILPHPSITLSTLNAPQDEIKGITPLCLASYLGKDVVVKCLLEAGKVDVDATDRKGATALMYAARDRHMAVVKTLLRHGASPDQTDSNGWSSIQYGQAYPEIVQMFEETLRCKRPEVLHLLTPPESPQPRLAVSSLDRSADGSNNAALPFALSQSLVRYPLYYSKLSSLLSSLPVAQSIVSTSNSNRDGTSALTLQLSPAGAVNNGVNNNALGPGGRTTSSEVVTAQQIQRTTHAALLEAIKLGDFMSLQSLLMAPPSLNDGQGGSSSGSSSGSNGGGGGSGGGSANVALVNHHDPQTGLTPLHHALRTRPLPSMETVKILYQAGADMNAQSHYGRTALHHLCRFSLEHALAPIVDDTSANNNNASASTTTTQQGSSTNSIGGVSGSTTTAVEDFKPHRRKHRHRTDTNGSAGSNHLTPTNGKEAPGSSAASTTSSNDLSTGPRHPHGTLMDTGAVKTASPEEIQRASQHLADCCRLLLRLGSLVNIADRHGNTPLHFAVEYGGVLEVVAVLVKEGADIEQRNTKGLNPLDVVRGEQSEEMRRILESGRSNAAGEKKEDGTLVSNTLVPAYQTRDSILKPLNLPETLHEVDFQFNQVLQNLEHYQNHTSVSIETSLQYITDQILLGWSPENQGGGTNGYGQSQEEYNADLVASLENLKYELESTYELLMITEEQYRDVITFYETELDEMTRQNLAVLTSYDSEKSKVTSLYSIYTRLLEQLEELEAENEGLKTELEEKKRRGLVSLGRLVHGAIGGQWSGSRNGTGVSLAKRKAALIKRNNEALIASTSLDEEQVSKDSGGARLEGLPRPSMVLMSQDALSGNHPSADQIRRQQEQDEEEEERARTIPRPHSPSLTVMSSENEPAMHTIAVLSQKVSLLEQELASKTCDIKERDLLVSELSDLIEEQSRTFEDELKSREERIDSMAKVLGRIDKGESAQTLVDELAVKMTLQEDKQRMDRGIVSASLSACGGDERNEPIDWTVLLKARRGSETVKGRGEQDIAAVLKSELELTKAQTSRLEMANEVLKERWMRALSDLDEIQQSEAANPALVNGSNSGSRPGSTNSSGHIDVGPGLDGTESVISFSQSVAGPRVTRVFVAKKRPQSDQQDEPLMLTLDEGGQPLPDSPTLEEIELVFEILMANLAEISRDSEEADLRLQECTRAKEQIYKRCLYLDGLQRKLDENVEKIVSQPFKADTQPPNFMQEQLKLQTQLNQLMSQAESVTKMNQKLKQDLQDYKEEKQTRLKELDQVRELMRKIGPQELLRGLLVKLEIANPENGGAINEARREAIATAVAQGMELAAELAAEEEENGGGSLLGGDRVASHLWRNSCSVIDEGDGQDAIDSRLETASIDYYTQSCSISDHKLFIQSLCSTLYALQMTTSHQIVSLKSSLAESRASLVLADQELSNLNDQIAGLYDEVGTLRNQLRGLQHELDRLIQHRKAEVEKVWEIVGEVRLTNGVASSGGGGSDGGAGMDHDQDDGGSVSSGDTNRKSASIQSRALATSVRHSNALAAAGSLAGTTVVAGGSSTDNGGHSSSVEGASGDAGRFAAASAAGGEGEGRDRDSAVARSLSISRAERASVLRRVSSPPVLSENDEETMSNGAISRVSHEYSDRGSTAGASTSELDRHALISAEMEKLRGVHLHLLSTITEYKKQISVVKDRNLKLVATLLDRERVRLWTADGQDDFINAMITANSSASSSNSSGHGYNNSNNTGSYGYSGSYNGHRTGGNVSTSVGAIHLGGEPTTMGSSSPSNNLLNPGIAAGTKKHHHLSLTAAEDGIKLLRCQLERIRQSEMTRFAEMGVGLTMNYPGLYPPPFSASGSESGTPSSPLSSLGINTSGGRVFGNGALSSSKPPLPGSLGFRSGLGKKATSPVVASSSSTADGASSNTGGASNSTGGASSSTGAIEKPNNKSSTNTAGDSQFEAALYSDLENRYSGQGGFR